MKTITITLISLLLLSLTTQAKEYNILVNAGADGSIYFVCEAESIEWDERFDGIYDETVFMIHGLQSCHKYDDSSNNMRPFAHTFKFNKSATLVNFDNFSQRYKIIALGFDRGGEMNNFIISSEKKVLEHKIIHCTYD